MAATLNAISSEFGDREAALCRELTKRHETIRRDRLSALSKFVEMDSNQQRGEAVILVAGLDATEVEMTPETAAWRERADDPQFAQKLPANFYGGVHVQFEPNLSRQQPRA